MSSAQRLGKLALDIERYVQWLLQHKPATTKISIRRRDATFLHEHPEEAARAGFVVLPDSITYRGFNVCAIVDQEVTRGEE